MEIYVMLLTLITPMGQRDVNQRIKQPSLEVCWQEAAKFLRQSVPEGLLGVAAGCSKQVVPKKEEDMRNKM